MNYNPSVLEINTRVWIRQFDTPEKRATLANIPDSCFDDFKAKGFDYIWFMGVWKTCPSTIHKYCFEDVLIKSYVKALKDWKPEDVIGSPYSIDVYELNPLLGNSNDLHILKERLNKKGIKLILDFVPNHFSADTSLINSNPEIFLKGTKENFINDPHTFFMPNPIEEKYFAHGKDPFFPVWQDTIQVNTFSNEARIYLLNVLSGLTNVCDGVRCDMAMLLLNNVFKNTWAGTISNYNQNAQELWSELITKVKNLRQDFLFMAEAYWDQEWTLQQLGFDYTYDKKLTDRLHKVSAKEVRDHLTAETEYQKKSLRFIENHDEGRAISTFGKDLSLAAAVIISTIQGMRFYHHGQFEGKKIKLPVQLGRDTPEVVNLEVKQFYERLLQISSREIFKKGTWTLRFPNVPWEGNMSYRNILAWEWIYNEQRALVVVNYSDQVSSCRIKLDMSGYSEELTFKDELNEQTYLRSAEEIHHSGLYVELKGYNSHIFFF